MKSYRYWFKGEFRDAINVCEEAVYLLEKGEQGSNFDIEHTLALSQRDSGNLKDIDRALEYFKGVHSLEELLSVTKLNGIVDGSILGNVGKCMYLKGDTEEALICYAKSYYYLLESNSHNRLINLGYASFWLADLLLELGANETAYYFYRLCLEYWAASSPVLLNINRSKLSKIESNSTYRSIASQELWRVEKFCNIWVKKHLKLSI